jgi:hypothetical protein
MSPRRIDCCARWAVAAHHRFLIAHHLTLIEELERHIEAFDARIEKLLAPLRNAVAQLITIPGMSQASARKSFWPRSVPT